MPSLLRIPWISRGWTPAHALSSPSPPVFNLSQHQGLFQWVISSHQVAKVLELSFSISPFNEYSGLICFRADWFDLLSVQGTLKNLLQRHNSKASILQRSVTETRQKSQHPPQWFIPGILVESSEPHDRPLQCGPASLSPSDHTSRWFCKEYTEWSGR